jgi:phosphate transport system ATP-binding protein
MNALVEKSLTEAGLYEEVKDNLNKSALRLSGGQQQRLCIARALAVDPEVIMMDEPTTSLDPISKFKIEDLMLKLKEKYTVLLVTHDIKQAARVSDLVAFLYNGKIIEYGETNLIFENPKNKITESFITGRGE